MSPDVPPDVPFVAMRETHIGVVFLIEDLAYKLTKPIRTPFLDFSTRQRRLQACQREISSSTGGWPRMCISASPRSPASTAVPVSPWW